MSSISAEDRHTLGHLRPIECSRVMNYFQIMILHNFHSFKNKFLIRSRGIDNCSKSRIWKSFPGKPFRSGAKRLRTSKLEILPFELLVAFQIRFPDSFLNSF